MIRRLINMMILLTIPALVMGHEQGKTSYILKPVMPIGAIKGIQIQFEVREINVIRQGKTLNILCLCADVTNPDEAPESLMVMYECLGQARVKELRLGGRQQKILLIDKCILTGEMTDEMRPDIGAYFNLVYFEFSR